MMRQVDQVKVAVVQACSVFMDREACVDKTCQLIEQASRQGARVILFPETLISGYPRGLSFGTVIGERKVEGRKDWARSMLTCTHR